MSDLSKPDTTSTDAAVEWKRKESSKGREYSVGMRKGEPGSGDAQAHSAERREPFSIDVNWPVNDNEDWTQTSDEVKLKAGITRYKLYRNTGFSPFWQYCLEFTNNQNFDYRFKDQSGDSYNVDTWRNSDHSVKYWSNGPTIKTIYGS